MKFFSFLFAKTGLGFLFRFRRRSGNIDLGPCFSQDTLDLRGLLPDRGPRPGCCLFHTSEIDWLSLARQLQ